MKGQLAQDAAYVMYTTTINGVQKKIYTFFTTSQTTSKCYCRCTSMTKLQVLIYHGAQFMQVGSLPFKSAFIKTGRYFAIGSNAISIKILQFPS